MLLAITGSELCAGGQRGGDVDFSTVSPRYAELKLQVTRGGRRVEAIKRLAFVEP